MKPHTTLQPAATLSIMIGSLAFFASAGGLWLKGLYRDNLFVTSAWRGNDIITLCLALPLLALSMWFAARGSRRARLVRLGVLDYMLYNYAFYLFGARFNAFFLLYVAITGLSLFALIFGLLDLDAAGIVPLAKPRMPIKSIAGYMVFVAAGLSFIYIAQSVGFILKGALPAIVTKSEHPTSVVFALDLILLVPVLALGALWLLRRKPWGYVLTGISMVKCPLYTLVLTAGSLSAAGAGVEGAGAEIPLWIGLTVSGMIAASLFYGSIRPEPVKS